MDFENKYGTLEMQKVLLGLLKRFDTFCIENSISYSVNDGTLLGAIRHKGFIPWDDDLDIIVDRKNYNKLLHVLDFSNYGLVIERVLWIDRIRLRTTDNVDEKRYKPTLDVFILDQAPKSKFHRDMKKLIIFFLQGMMKPKPDYSRFNFLNKLLSFVSYNIGKLFTQEQKIVLYHKISSHYGSRNSPYSSCYNETYSAVGIVHSANVLDNLERRPFEDIEVSILSSYHNYLTEIYGDYMTPPQENKRIPQHSGK